MKTIATIKTVNFRLVSGKEFEVKPVGNFRKINEEYNEMNAARMVYKYHKTKNNGEEYASELIDLIQASVTELMQIFSEEQIKEALERHYNKMLKRKKKKGVCG